jgi:putative transposase
VVTANQKRLAAEHLQKRCHLSERHAAELLGASRSTVRYERRVRDDEPVLIDAIRRHAKKKPQWGYRFIWSRLRTEGWRVSQKRVLRLWRSLGLQKPLRRRKNKGSKAHRGGSENSCFRNPSQHRNDVWTCDFLFTRTISGGTLKWLTVVDEYTREVLAIRVSSEFQGKHVRAVFAELFGRYGEPRRIRSDNGSEFVCSVLTEWLETTGVEGIQVAPGSPWENGFIESFHSRLRAEFLDGEEFEDVADARMKAREWRSEYNRERPHSSIDFKTPKVYAAECHPVTGKHPDKC